MKYDLQYLIFKNDEPVEGKALGLDKEPLVLTERTSFPGVGSQLNFLLKPKGRAKAFPVTGLVTGVVIDESHEKGDSTKVDVIIQQVN